MICAIAQQKGGVGKTTTAANLAVLLARHGSRVLVVDTDPQFALTRQLGIDIGWTAVNLVHVLTGRVEAADAVVGGVHGVDVLPAARELAGVEMSLVGEVGREGFLRDALEPLSGTYDAVVLDTPPNLGLLTVNALLCADTVIAPVSAEDEASVQGLVELRATLTKLHERMGAAAWRPIAILTRWQRERILGQVIEAELHRLGLPPAVRIPLRAAVGQAGAERLPIALAAPDGAVALAYEALAGKLQRGEVAGR